MATKKKPTAPLDEIGAIGLKREGNDVADEWLKDLNSSEKRYKLYREVRDNSPVIGGAMLAIENLLRRVDVFVRGGKDEDQEFIHDCMDDMSHPWETVISQALSALTYGFSVHELVYKKRQGPDAKIPSKYNDGKIGWRKFAFRSQESLFGWNWDKQGGVESFIQQPAPEYRERTIPMEKMLLYRVNDWSNNPEGRSCLRNCILTWKFVKRIQVIEGIGIERDLAGLPVAWVPAEVASSTATGENAVVQTKMKELVTRIRRDEQEGILMPLVYDQSGNKRYDLTLLSTGGRRSFDTGEIIHRYEQRMLIAMLSDFILLGHENVGSFSLSSDKTSMFTIAIASWLESILATINRFAIPRLLKMNGRQSEEMPELRHGDIETQDLNQLATYLQMLTATQMVKPNEELSKHLLQLANLPTSASSTGAEGPVSPLGGGDPNQSIFGKPPGGPPQQNGNGADREPTETLRQFRKMLAQSEMKGAGGS